MITTNKETKDWFRLKDRPNATKVVEYSKHFKFFLEHQIGVAKSHTTYTFYSKLENKHFLTKKVIFGNDYTLSDKEIVELCREIHEEILDGKHGIGEFVN